jgi:ubiquinone/menaquinone biosynthesis C-methylase UbiE
MPTSAELLKAEECRIQAVYARRRSGDLYSRFNPAYLFMVQDREKHFLKLLSGYESVPLENKKILEIGCGNGDLLRDFIKWGARPQNITGIDLLPERVAEAIELCPKLMEIRRGNAARLEFPNETFDLVMQSTVFTSVLDIHLKTQMATEMCRVLKHDGLILWYDFHMSNPSNPDVKGVQSREIKALFPRCEIRLQRITLAPPLTRLLAPYSWLACYILGRLPWLCTHYIGIIRKANRFSQNR